LRKPCSRRSRTGLFRIHIGGRGPKPHAGGKPPDPREGARTKCFRSCSRPSTARRPCWSRCGPHR